MNNGDMPAIPGPSISERVQLRGATEGTMTTEYVTVHGLTKRETFAAMAMQGLCTKGTDNIAVGYYATMSVRHADALLDALETKEEE